MPGRMVWAHKVYFRSQMEYDYVRALAARTGRNLSTLMRDCVVEKLAQYGWDVNAVPQPTVTKTYVPEETTQTPKPLFPMDMKFDTSSTQASNEKELMEILETKSESPKTESPEEGYDVELDPNDPTHMKSEG